ncbi:superinfection exclusion B family protein [Variovorax sp. J22R24]|uniref:superinfection exclusion B family protein n=1 Tax=Variovorax gracilis TaxID=3053502 RepID=UPI002576A8AD|nr:superinfection exclusion B family protein [Variovorax sp. J22R24]MDM0109849.1 superinfection exclusion B family protein [Variovorax sp. J22R24]
MISTAGVAGILLFSPFSLVETLGLVELVAEHRKYIGLGFLISGVLLAADGGWQAVKLIRTKLKSRRIRATGMRWLADLTPDEKAHLLPYISEAETTQYLAVDDGVVNGLISKGVLYRAASVGSVVDGFAVNMQPWARKCLNKDPELLWGAGPRPLTPRERFWAR